MQPFPHRYAVEASGSPRGSVDLLADGVEAIASAAPAEFGGPGDQWSPETLLVAAVADCFVLTFRAIAQASRFDWETLRCRAEGTLDRVDGKTRFVALELEVELAVAPEARRDTAQRLLEKAEGGCLITNSLAIPVEARLSVRGAA